MPVNQVTLVGNIVDLSAVPAVGSFLLVQLCNFGETLPRVSATGLLLSTNALRVPTANGAYNFNLELNSIITPSSTYYTIQVCDVNGSVVQTAAYLFAVSATFDLSTLAPYNPPAPIVLPPNPVLLNPAGLQVIAGSLIVAGSLNGATTIQAFSATPAFDASAANTFELTLTGNVTSSTLTGKVTGQMVTFIITQDGTGGRTFVWPAIVKNAGEVSPLANSVSAQTFIVASNGNLYPIGPMTFS